MADRKQDHSDKLSKVVIGDILEIQAGTYARDFGADGYSTWFFMKPQKVIVTSVKMKAGVGRKWDKFYFEVRSISSGKSFWFESCRSEFLISRLPATEATKVLYG